MFQTWKEPLLVFSENPTVAGVTGLPMLLALALLASLMERADN